MSTAIEASLITYELPEELPPTEAKLIRRKNRAFNTALCVGASGATQICIFLVCIYTDILLPDVNSASGFGSLIIGAILLLIAYKAYRTYEKDEQQLFHFYEQVEIGEVLDRGFSGGKNVENPFYVRIQGNNRLNQLTTYDQPVNAGKWYDGFYPTGKIVDFREDQEE